MRHFFWIILIVLLSACGPGGNQTGSAPENTAEQPGAAALPTSAPTPIVQTTPQDASTLPAQGDLPPTGEQTQGAPTPESGAPSQELPAQATAFPDPGAYRWQAVATGLDTPVGLENAGDGSGRLFVLEQAGRILILQDGQALPQPFLDITERVGSSGTEQGLLGLAFHPRYTENGYFYINYTDLNGDTVIARFSASPDDPNRADPNSESILIQVEQPFPNHNGGVVTFGPDGYLYLGLGDGGSGGDPHNNAQSLDTLLGKILRIDVDGGEPYAIPADNPFRDGSGKPEIWAYGLRNPWRLSFDRQTGDLYIADVGQNKIEEIDFLPAGSPGGANFGWRYKEGNQTYNGEPPAGMKLIDPVAEYPHSEGCSVTGGYVYRGSALPEWQGIYLYGDFCSGNVWGLLRGADGQWQNRRLFEAVASISSFGEDESGELYIVDRRGRLLVLAR